MDEKKPYPKIVYFLYILYIISFLIPSQSILQYFKDHAYLEFERFYLLIPFAAIIILNSFAVINYKQPQSFWYALIATLTFFVAHNPFSLLSSIFDSLLHIFSIGFQGIFWLIEVISQIMIFLIILYIKKKTN